MTEAPVHPALAVLRPLYTASVDRARRRSLPDLLACLDIRELWEGIKGGQVQAAEAPTEA